MVDAEVGLRLELSEVQDRLDQVEVSAQQGSRELLALKKELRQRPPQRLVERGPDGATFLAGAATGAALTFLLSRPDVLQRLGLEETEVRHLLAEQEKAVLPQPLEAPMYYYFAAE